MTVRSRMFAVFPLLMMLAHSGVGQGNNAVCSTNEDCTTDRLCANNKCIDPCVAGVCGQNTFCHVTEHAAVCACQTDYDGHPFTGCYPAPADRLCKCPSCPNVTSSRPTTPVLPGRRKGKKQYYLYANIQMNWYQAFVYCRSLDMHLASFDNKEEYEQLFNLIIKSKIPGPPGVWISATDLGQSGVYMWMSSGRPVTYVIWRDSSEPSHGKFHDEIERCLVLSWEGTYKMNDEICSNKNFVACEHEGNIAE